MGLIFLGILVFLPAGSFKYWQGWAFMTVFVGATVSITSYLAKHDPSLLERRMRAGPTAEKEVKQKIIMSFALLGFLALIVLSALDYRFHWSSVPFFGVLGGDLLIILGYFLTFLVLKENSYAASTIQIADDQKVISTGPYAVVRHPMYAGALVMVTGMPLALGSYWGLIIILFFAPILMWRLLDEERFLNKNLQGYADYTQKVRYRLIPYLW
jgi:protein-S-isoprenylcysteine O-methyltransferase Ste14